MATDLILRKDGVLVKSNIRNPLTGKDSTHQELVGYSSLPKKMSLLGVQIEPLSNGNVTEIKLTVERFSTEDLSTEITGVRKGTRKERIAKLLMDHKGRPYTARELCRALDEKDIPNLQWEAKKLVESTHGFDIIMKDGLTAYVYIGS